MKTKNSKTNTPPHSTGTKIKKALFRSFLFFTLLLAFAKVFGQNTFKQNPVWAIPNNFLKFNSPSTNPAAPTITNMSSTVQPNYSSNCAFDDAGKPLFYIIDNKFYDANGNDISNTAFFNYPQIYDYFGNPTNDFANYGSEVIIFKDETQCKLTYDIIYSVVKLNSSNLPIRSALLHAKIYYDGNNWVKYTANDELLYILPQYTKSSTYTMALSSKDTQGRRFLFAKAGGELNVWKYENGNFGSNQITEFGFTHTAQSIPHIYLTGNVQYWEEIGRAHV